MSRNYVGKKQDTFHLGWGADEASNHAKVTHPLKPSSQFTLGWGVTQEKEVPRNSFNPHTHQIADQFALNQRNANKLRNQRGSNIFNNQTEQVSQPIYHQEPLYAQKVPQEFYQKEFKDVQGMPSASEYDSQLNPQERLYPQNYSNNYDENYQQKYENNYQPEYQQEMDNQYAQQPHYYYQDENYLNYKNQLNQNKDPQYKPSVEKIDPNYYGQEYQNYQNGFVQKTQQPQNGLNQHQMIEQSVQKPQVNGKYPQMEQMPVQQEQLYNERDYGYNPKRDSDIFNNQQEKGQDQNGIYNQNPQNFNGRDYGYVVKRDNDIFNSNKPQAPQSSQNSQFAQSRKSGNASNNSNIFFGDYDNSFRSSYQDQYKKK